MSYLEQSLSRSEGAAQLQDAPPLEHAVMEDVQAVQSEQFGLVQEAVPAARPPETLTRRSFVGYLLGAGALAAISAAAGRLPHLNSEAAYAGGPDQDHDSGYESAAKAGLTLQQYERIQALQSDRLSWAEIRSNWKPRGERRDRTERGDAIFAEDTFNFMEREVKSRPKLTEAEKAKVRIVIEERDFSDLTVNESFQAAKQQLMDFTRDMIAGSGKNPADKDEISKVNVFNSLALKDELYILDVISQYTSKTGKTSQSMPFESGEDHIPISSALTAIYEHSDNKRFEAGNPRVLWADLVTAARQDPAYLQGVFTDDVVAKYIYSEGYSHRHNHFDNSLIDIAHKNLLKSIHARYDTTLDPDTLREIDATAAALEYVVVEPMQIYVNSFKKVAASPAGKSATGYLDHVGIWGANANIFEGYIEINVDNYNNYEPLVGHETEHMIDGMAVRRGPGNTKRLARRGVGYVANRGKEVHTPHGTFKVEDVLGPYADVGYDFNHGLVDLAGKEALVPADKDPREYFFKYSYVNNFMESSPGIGLLAAEILDDKPLPTEPAETFGIQAGFYGKDGGFDSEGYKLLQRFRHTQRDPRNPEIFKQVRRDWLDWFEGDYSYNPHKKMYVEAHGGTSAERPGFGPGAWNRLMLALAVGRKAGALDNIYNVADEIREALHADKMWQQLMPKPQVVTVRSNPKAVLYAPGLYHLHPQTAHGMALETMYPRYHNKITEILQRDWRIRHGKEKTPSKQAF